MRLSRRTGGTPEHESMKPGHDAADVECKATLILEAIEISNVCCLAFATAELDSPDVFHVTCEKR